MKERIQIMEINRQYIGARYVPKFYEGSNGTEWDANHIYEPLTIVTYLNNSYTSKKNVPASVGNPMANPEYWVATGNYNAQIQEYKAEVDAMAIEVEKIVNSVKGGTLEKFRDKKIYVIGDSISDETTYQPNWVDYLTTVMATVNATVINASITGSSLVGWATDPSAPFPTDGDVYIVALGVNDFQGQFSIYDIRNAFATFATRLVSADTEVFYLSPIKTYGEARLTKYTPLSAYRKMFETFATSLGMHVISGFDMTLLNVLNQTTYLADTLHPASVFAPIFCQYIVDNMCSSTSSFSPVENYRKSCELLATVNSGYVYLYWNGKDFVINYVLVGLSLSAGWNDICYLKDPEGNDGISGATDNICCGYFIDSNTGTMYQHRISNGKLQVYSTNAVTISPYGYIPYIGFVDNIGS